MSQWNLKTDKRVSSINIYIITKRLDYNMFSEISKQQNKSSQVNSTSCTQPYSCRKQQVINIQEVLMYFWGTLSK